MNTSSTPTRNSCRVLEVFDAQGLTSYGGANLLSDFMNEHLHPYDELEQLPIEKAEWAEYSLADELSCLIMGYALGMERIMHMDDMQYDPLLCLKLGLDELPQCSTL